MNKTELTKQIRLIGLDFQKKFQAALIAGVNGSGVKIAKNMVFWC